MWSVIFVSPLPAWGGYGFQSLCKAKIYSPHTEVIEWLIVIFNVILFVIVLPCGCVGVSFPTVCQTQMVAARWSCCMRIPCGSTTPSPRLESNAWTSVSAMTSAKCRPPSASLWREAVSGTHRYYSPHHRPVYSTNRWMEKEEADQKPPAHDHLLTVFKAY